MFEREIILNKFMIAYVLQMIQDIPEEKWYYTSSHCLNSPGWCIGHITTECDHALLQLGKERVCPGTWDVYFLQGSRPEENNDKLPKMSALVDAFQLSHKRLRLSVQKLSAEEVSRPSPSKFLKPFLPKFGDWLTHMLTTHIAMHAGNIAAWRRVAGLVPISQKGGTVA